MGRVRRWNTPSQHRPGSLGSLALSGVAAAAEPPAGAVISDSLEYVGRVADSAGIVEGKLDSVGGRSVLVTTGLYGFRTYDVSDGGTRGCSTRSSRQRCSAPAVTGRTRTWSSTFAAS
jgi:hypothetical protein